MIRFTRRDLLLTGAALTILPSALRAEEMLEYRPGLAAEHLAEGNTVLLDFSAVWCSTCRAQGRAIQTLRDQNAAYDAEITFIRVDWDQYGRSELALDLNVPRRSTLILLRGEDELGRVVASTRAGDIQDLLDLALS